MNFFLEKFAFLFASVYNCKQIFKKIQNHYFNYYLLSSIEIDIFVPPLLLNINQNMKISSAIETILMRIFETSQHNKK